jgi:hypothetical protein
VSKSPWKSTASSFPSASAAIRARIDAAHGTVEQPRSGRDQRLEREVELAAETAADCRGDDPHLLLRKAEHQRQLVAIHVGRLRAGEDLDTVADAARVSGLRFDIGMLDETRPELALGNRRRRGECRLDIAAEDAA